MASSHVDADLLFGLLALQNGMVDQTQARRTPSRPGRPTRPGPWPTTSSTGATSPHRSAPSSRRSPPGTWGPGAAAWNRPSRPSAPGSPAARRSPCRPNPRSRRPSPSTPPFPMAAPAPTVHPTLPSAPPQPTGRASAPSASTPRAGLAPSTLPSTRSCIARSALKQILDRHADDPISRAASSSRPRSPAAWSTPASSPFTAWAPMPTVGPTTRCGSSRAKASRIPSTGSTPTSR